MARGSGSSIGDRSFRGRGIDSRVQRRLVHAADELLLLPRRERGYLRLQGRQLLQRKILHPVCQTHTDSLLLSPLHDVSETAFFDVRIAKVRIAGIRGSGFV